MVKKQSKYYKLKKHYRYSQSDYTLPHTSVGLRKMGKSLLKHHCYCPMLLMRTTKTPVCLQTKAIFHHLYEFYLVF